MFCRQICRRSGCADVGCNEVKGQGERRGGTSTMATTVPPRWELLQDVENHKKTAPSPDDRHTHGHVSVRLEESYERLKKINDIISRRTWRAFHYFILKSCSRNQTGARGSEGSSRLAKELLVDLTLGGLLASKQPLRKLLYSSDAPLKRERERGGGGFFLPGDITGGKHNLQPPARQTTPTCKYSGEAPRKRNSDFLCVDSAPMREAYYYYYYCYYDYKQRRLRVIEMPSRCRRWSSWRNISPSDGRKASHSRPKYDGKKSKCS